jgi:hypothetical protein
MKVRVDIARLVILDQSMSRRARMNLREDIGRELSHLMAHRTDPAPPSRRSAPSVATQIAQAVVAQLPPAGPKRTGPRS